MIHHPDFKVNITHDSEATDYVNSHFIDLNVKRRENNYDVASLTALNDYADFYANKISKFDEVKIYFKNRGDADYTQVFGGEVRQLKPAVDPTGKLLYINCKGYGAALEETHCNRDYGLESANSSLDTLKEIWQDQVDNMINKSLGSASSTGYAITKTKIADIEAATSIKYVNNPYRTNIELLDITCKLASAIADGDAGPHWIVDNSKNLIINTIGDHENTTEWPNYWNSTQAASTLTEGVDFQTLGCLDKAEEYANKIVLVTDFRRPAYDYWTEDSGGAALWGNDNLEAITNDNAAGHFVVGSHSLKLDPDGAAAGYAYFPATDAEWNITKWGSIKTIPRLNFYCWKNSLTTTTTYVILSTNDTARKTDYFYTTFLNWQSEADDTWYHKSIPIGPYWASAEETKQFRWSEQGSPVWEDIDTVEFAITGAGADGYLLIDDLHFSGKIIRSADYHTTYPVSATNTERQKVFISRESMDDSVIASDDTGFAGRIAKAELLRRHALPVTVTFQTSLKPGMMAGQKLHLHALKLAAGTYQLDADYRITEVEHTLNMSGAASTVTATSDLTNSFPINIPDQYQLMIENLLLNSGEAKNMRATSEVDLLIPILEKSY